MLGKGYESRGGVGLFNEVSNVVRFEIFVRVFSGFLTFFLTLTFLPGGKHYTPSPPHTLQPSRQTVAMRATSSYVRCAPSNWCIRIYVHRRENPTFFVVVGGCASLIFMAIYSAYF